MAEKQLIVVIGREHGSYGHEVAAKLAEKRGIKLYDKQILNDLAEHYDLGEDFVDKYDEKPRNQVLARLNSTKDVPMEDVLAQKVFLYERRLAASGESFVIVGRCADSVLRDNPNMINIFITGSVEDRIAHIMESKGLSYEDAADRVWKVDHDRKMYHDDYSDTKWSQTDAYDLVINCPKIGLDNTVALIDQYITLKEAE